MHYKVSLMKMSIYKYLLNVETSQKNNVELVQVLDICESSSSSQYSLVALQQPVLIYWHILTSTISLYHEPIG
uniref:Uncharacterized protein n=1 Tax=Glossina morsitans morsitans TaxID=37546 RepID=A0ABK9MLK5_GLOMM